MGKRGEGETIRVRRGKGDTDKRGREEKKRQANRGREEEERKTGRDREQELSLIHI